MAKDYTRPYGDAATSNFPKMGEHPLEGNVVNVSGERSPYTNNRPKGGPTSDSEPGIQAVRGVGAMATGENAGPVFAPQTTISFPNSPEAATTGRAVKTVPSATRGGRFWHGARAEAGQVIAE